MSMRRSLTKAMTVREFENGYWYARQLKTFAEQIGIPAAQQLRKDELEKAIVMFLRTGTRVVPTTRALRKTGVKDLEKIPSVCYINFLAEFLAREKRATHADARAAWKELKALDVPKDYRSWRKARTDR